MLMEALKAYKGILNQGCEFLYDQWINLINKISIQWLSDFVYNVNDPKLIETDLGVLLIYFIYRY